MMTRTERTATRAYWRLLGDFTKGMDEHAEAEMAFDGGEWSAGFLDRLYWEAEDRAAAIVGSRFFMDGTDVKALAEQAANDWTDGFYAAMRADADDLIRLHCGFDPAKEERA